MAVMPDAPAAPRTGGAAFEWKGPWPQPLAVQRRAPWRPFLPPRRRAPHTVPSHPCPPPRHPRAEGIRNGLDFEQALADPDLPELVTSVQMLIQLRRFNTTAQGAIAARSSRQQQQRQQRGGGGGGGGSPLSQDLGSIIGSATSDTAEIDTSVGGERRARRAAPRLLVGCLAGAFSAEGSGRDAPGFCAAARALLSHAPALARPRALLALKPPPPPSNLPLTPARRAEARGAAAGGAGGPGGWPFLPGAGDST